jgi:hypothetical protein
MTKTKKFHALLRQWKMLQLLPSKYPKDAAIIREDLKTRASRLISARFKETLRS